MLDVIVGVNKYRLKNEDKVDVRSIDNESVRNQQVWYGMVWYNLNRSPKLMLFIRVYFLNFIGLLIIFAFYYAFVLFSMSVDFISFNAIRTDCEDQCSQGGS